MAHSTGTSPASSAKLLLIDLPADRSVTDHPEVARHLRAGWTVATAEPRIVEPGQPRMLVTLTRDVAVRAA